LGIIVGVGKISGSTQALKKRAVVFAMALYFFGSAAFDDLVSVLWGRPLYGYLKISGLSIRRHLPQLGFVPFIHKLMNIALKKVYQSKAIVAEWTHTT